MEQPHSLCRARKASGADAAGNFNGWSPCALCHGAVCSPQSPSPCRPSPAPWRTAGRGAARRRRQREEWSLRMAPCSQPHSAGRIAAADLHRLPFQEGLHCPGLADLIPCLRGLVKEKEGRKKKKKKKPEENLWVLLKILHHNPPQEHSSLCTSAGRRFGSPGDPGLARRAGTGLTRSCQGEEGPAHIKGSEPGSLTGTDINLAATHAVNPQKGGPALPQ